IYAVRKQHAQELRIEGGDALAEKTELVIAERNVEFGPAWKIPRLIRKLERPHVVCVEPVYHRDLISVRHLGGSAVKSLFFLLLVFLFAEMGPQDPVADADADFVRSLDRGAAEKAHSDADA